MKFLFYRLVLLILSPTVFSSDFQEMILKDSRYKGLHYRGEVNAKGQPHGFGYLWGAVEGSGRFAKEEGEVVGEFRDGFLDGLVVMKIINTQTEYSGEMKKGYQEGVGVSTSKNGVYRGEHVRSSRDGFGIQLEPDGSVYKGEWKRNVKRGLGYLKEVDGVERMGEFSDGKFGGLGMSRSTSQEILVLGEYENGTLNGLGMSRNVQKNYLRLGEFSQGEAQHGLMAMKSLQGDLQILSDASLGVGFLALEGGGRYIGEIQDELPHGQGILQVDGERFLGGFSRGLRHGDILILHKDGSREFSTWEEGRRLE